MKLYFSLYPIISCYCRTNCCRHLHFLLRLFCTPVPVPCLMLCFSAPVPHRIWKDQNTPFFTRSCANSGYTQGQGAVKGYRLYSMCNCPVSLAVFAAGIACNFTKKTKKLRWDNVNMRFFTSSCNDFPLDWEFFRMRMSSENRDKAPKPRNTSV